MRLDPISAWLTCCIAGMRHRQCRVMKLIDGFHILHRAHNSTQARSSEKGLYLTETQDVFLKPKYPGHVSKIPGQGGLEGHVLDVDCGILPGLFLAQPPLHPVIGQSLGRKKLDRVSEQLLCVDDTKDPVSSI